MTVSEMSRRLNLYAALYQTRLRSWISGRLRGDWVAEDIAQETWARAAPALAHGRVDNVEAYLHRVASNLIVDRAREERRRAEIFAVGIDEADGTTPGAGAEEQLMERDRMTLLSAIVADLPPRCREVFLLRKREGLSTNEIAGRIGIGRNMVDKHLRRALMIIATRLGEVEA